MSVEFIRVPKILLVVFPQIPFWVLVHFDLVPFRVLVRFLLVPFWGTSGISTGTVLGTSCFPANDLVPVNCLNKG